ncbi:uncharacterized protein LOC128327726 isoform X2 [Hemicordylus capensis]|uniref:uncharacterized protein LOC128327726 isoform X2 n=1 Tax=Hemicordylus capensis TaxID=884348 RepID=UPI002302779F|nr:uncharacterized protein LOC128327726 isoform X2 [Hemicordylus capensis]
MEEKPSGMHDILERDAQTFLMHETSELQADLLRKSKSLDPQELSRPSASQLQGPRKAEIPQTPGYPKKCPHVLEKQMLKRLEIFPPQENAQVVRDPLQDSKVLQMESESSVQKEPRGLESSQKKPGESESGALDSQENNDFKVQGQKEMESLQQPGTVQTECASLQVQGRLQKNQMSLESTDLCPPYVLRLEEETLLRQSEFMGHRKSTAQLPLRYQEMQVALPWRSLLGKSKSLDLGELQAVQSEASTELENPMLQNPQSRLEKGMQTAGEEAMDPVLLEREQAGICQPPRPRPPRREKAFIWLSRQEKEEALQQLAKLQAEGERRHQRDKERQSLRFQERLSIAKHRKSEEDLLGGSPVERWPPHTEPPGQDQAGQKTALKRHLEKVKRERTYVMQSKRERNTLRFKELLDPLVAQPEESPEPGEV